MVEPATISNSEELFIFLNSTAEPTNGLITTSLQINFDFTSHYIKVLTSDNANVKITSSINY